MLAKASAYGLELRYPAGDDTIGACLARYGEFARPEFDFLVAHAPSDGGTLIDVGANIGAICLPFAQERPQWRVVALEAHRGLANVLATNTFANELFNVEAFHAAVGARAGIVRFPAPSLRLAVNYGTMTLTKSPASAEPVQMFRLDGIAPRDTRLIKIDVEGYEAEVLKGAANLLAARKAIWLVEAGPSRPALFADLVGTFERYGYALRWFFAPFATPTSRETPEWPMVGDLNLAAFPASEDDLWDLPLASGDCATPPKAEAFTYLRAYGYSL